ncbi:MAG: 16S rRNA (cytosine(1402)-N(4))-methyltransferase RsmH [Terriglobales bacterium]
MAGAGHVAVMAAEVVEYLAPRAGGVYVDCTLGAAGHTLAIAAAMGRGRMVGFDKDPKAVAVAREALAGRAAGGEVAVETVQGDYGEAASWLRAHGIEAVDGVVADLGMSSMQLADTERGFSFAADGPLDMRMDPRQPLTAEQVVNQFDERTLADLIFQYGDERRSRRIARAIVRSRPLRGTAQLAGLVAAVNRAGHRRGIHPATRTFQALRIYVNAELESLERMLAWLPGMLKPGGRAVVISFHSLEDRPVKQRFREGAQGGWYGLLTRRALRAQAEELTANPRARSAKLRAVERSSGAAPAWARQEGRHGHLLPATN